MKKRLIKKEIIVVILCASGKDDSVGCMSAENSGKAKKVKFVADPENAPLDQSIIYKRPDDIAPSGQSWRKKLEEYNREYERDHSSNPLELVPAYQLYEPRAPYKNIYRELVDFLGISNVFILSAGWGLISAGFLTPCYDITFSREASKKNPCAFRLGKDNYLYKDFAELPEDNRKPVVFLGSKAYIRFFCSLTENVKARKIIFHKSKSESTYPQVPKGYELRRSEATPRVWYYECAKQLIRGKIKIDR